MAHRINRKSKLPWAKLNWKVPYQTINEEYNSLDKKFFVNQRPDDKHSKWYATTLFGHGYDKTNSHWEYRNLKTQKKITRSGELCPKTLSWVKTLPYTRIDDVRFLVLKAGGFISPHIDVPERSWLDPVSIAIDWPENCSFNFTLHGKVPFNTGDAFILNIHYEHAVNNFSSFDRVNLLIHGRKSNEFWKSTIY